MKKVIFAVVLVGLVFLVSTSESPPYSLGGYTPVFMKRIDLEKSVSYIPGSRSLKNPGKIYYKHPYLFRLMAACIAATRADLTVIPDICIKTSGRWGTPVLYWVSDAVLALLFKHQILLTLKTNKL